jgi:hypothetical protein
MVTINRDFPEGYHAPYKFRGEIAQRFPKRIFPRTQELTNQALSEISPFQQSPNGS